MVKVRGRATSVNVQKVMWAVGEMAIAHDRIDASGRFGGLATPAFRDHVMISFEELRG